MYIFVFVFIGLFLISGTQATNTPKASQESGALSSPKEKSPKTTPPCDSQNVIHIPVMFN